MESRGEIEAKARLLRKMRLAENRADASYSKSGDYDKAKLRLKNALALDLAIKLVEEHLVGLPKADSLSDSFWAQTCAECGDGQAFRKGTPESGGFVNSYDVKGGGQMYFCDDCAATSTGSRCEKDKESDANGRFRFVLVRGERRCEIDMPGLPIDRVRYVGGEGQDIWDFPRLYVDGSSWVWKFAVNRARDKLSEEDVS